MHIITKLLPSCLIFKPLFMKTNFLSPFAIVSLFLMAFVFNSCKKEIEASSLNSERKESKKPSDENAKTCLYPTIESPNVGLHCSDGNGCGMGMLTSTTRHRVTWTVGSDCSPSTPYPNIAHYAVYKQTGIAAYSQIASFSCSSTAQWYASTLLTNGSTFIIVVKDSDSPASIPSFPTTITEDSFGYLYNVGGASFYYTDSWKFTTGTGAGASCGGIKS